MTDSGPLDNRPLWGQSRRAVREPAAQANYRRFVGGLKIALPVSAFLLLGLVIAWPTLQTEDDSFGLTFIKGTVEDDTLRMVQPRYTGADAKNRRYAITAIAATQDVDDPGRVQLDQMEADITLTDSTWVSVVAPAGRFHADAQTLDLEGPIEIFTNIGYELHAQSVHVAFAEWTAQSPDPISGHGPAGEIQADAFEVLDSGNVIRFLGGVRTLINPAWGG